MLYEIKGKNTKKDTLEINHKMLFGLVGDNSIELVSQRTAFEGVKRRANASESRMQEVTCYMR